MSDGNDEELSYRRRRATPKDVAPIFAANCTGCHSPGRENADKPLTTYGEATKLRNSGQLRALMRDAAVAAPAALEDRDADSRLLVQRAGRRVDSCRESVAGNQLVAA